MKNKKPVFMLTVMLMGILTQFMTSVSTIQAFAATGESIIEKPSAYLLEKDKYGNPTIFTSVKMVVKDKDGNNEDITESRPLKVGEAFNIEYVFRIPDQLGKEVEAGDYFEFDLPDSEDIQLTSVQTGPLVDPDNGAIYGDFIAEKNGHVIMTFNENVKTHDDVDGKLAFTVKFEEKTIHIPGGYEIDFPYVVDGGDTIIYVKGEHDSYIQKEYLGNEGFTYRWKALINPKYQKMRQLELWEETKEIGGGTAIAESINIEKMVKADVKLNGDVFEHDEEVSLKNKTFDSNGNIDLGFDSIDEPYVIYLNTPFEFGISNTVRNTIRLKATIDGQDIGESASAETNSGSHSIIDKKVEHYDRDNQTISWLVTYNPGGFHIKEEDAYFHDEITNGTLVDNSMTVEPSLKHRVDVATNKQSFDFQFETDVKEPVYIRYETKVIDTTPIPNPPNAPIKNSVKNKVIAKEQEKEVIQPVTPGGDGEDGEGGEGGGDETSSIIKKVREADQNGAIWTLHINPENKSLDRWWVTDRVDSGSIRQSTLNVKNKYTGATVHPSEYELDWDKNEKGEVVGFTLEYNHKTSDDFEITYQTNVDRNTTQRNKAVYHYTIKGSEKEDEASTSYDPIQVGEIGLSKSGRYIPESKEIEWTVLINNSTKVPVAPNNLLRDPILDNQTFVEGSVKYDFMDGAWQSHYKPEITFNEEENQLEVRKLKEANNKQRIIFRTQLKDKMEILEQPIYNTAYYSDDYTDEKEATASLTIDNANDYVLRKQGKQNEQNDKLIDWTIDINPYGHKLDNLVIYDESWENQKVIKETIEIKDAFTQTPLLEGVDYDLEYTERSFTIRMRDRVDQHLILTYQGFLFFPDGTALGSDQTVSNSVRITADRVIKTDKPITKTVKVKVSESSGIIEGKVRDLNVIKVSEEDNSRVLPGAEFTLYRGTEKDESKIVDKQVTSHEGEALFTRLTKGDYLLVETKAPEGYDISSEMANGRVITVTTEETTTIEELVSNPKVGSENFVEFPVEKKWKNVPNYMETPEITVWLLANGDRKESMVLNEANHYQGTFRQLPEKENGTTIDYSIEEVAVEGYESHISGGTITNTFITKTTHLTGKKIWRNDEASDRPEKVEIQLLQDGNDFGESITVTKGDSWEYEFNDLPKVNDQTGIDYEYSVKELNVSDKYESIVEGTDVINTKIDEPVDFEKINIKGQKRWVGDNEYLRPESITIELKQNGAYYDHQIITADDSWAYEFNDLDKQDEFGNDYTYTVEEKNVPSVYDVSYSEFDITNTYKKEELVSVSGEKKWIGDNNEVRPDSIRVRLIKNSEETELTQEVKGPNWTYSFTELPKYQENSSEENVYTVKEENVPEGYVPEVDAENNIINTWTEEPLVNIPVVKLWDDSQNIFDTRPEYIYVFLYRVNYENVENPILVDEADISGDAHADEWEYVFEDLPKFDEKGRENHYYVKEILMSDSLYEQTSKGTTITNTLPKLKTEIKGKKTWKKDTEYDRPDEITVELYGTDKNKVLQSVTTSARNDWEYEFVDLDKYDDQNNEIDYTVKEVNVPGYESEVDSNNNITNTKKEPDKTTISGEKRWENDTEGVRPEKIEVTLLQNSAVKETITVTPDNNGHWKYEFTDLPVTDSKGDDYIYEVKEKTAIPGYESIVDGYDITNIYDSSLLVTIKGKKHWKDQTESTRPDAIYVILEQAIQESGVNESDLDWKQLGDKQKVTKDENWSYEFTDLPVQDENGESFVYRVIEDRESIDWKADYETVSVGYDLYNVLQTGTIDLEGEKTWVEPEGNAQFRPESIRIHLYQDNVELKDKAQTVKSDKDQPVWTYRFEELEKTNPETMKDYVYTVREEPVPNYDTSYDGMNITNTLNQTETVAIKGEKMWDDLGFESHRPDKVTIELYRKTATKPLEKVTSVETSELKNWEYEFLNQPKYDEETLEEYTYSVKEVPVPGYNSVVLGYDISNEYINDSKINVSGKKIWKDNDFPGRPKSVEVVLYQGTKEYDRKGISGDTDEWHYSFKELPEFDNKGNAYVYTVKEINVPSGYTSKVEGTTITNTYENKDTVDVSGEKIWIDYNDKFETRPETITVKLLQNNKEYTEQEVSEGSDKRWQYAFNDLPKYDSDHKEYDYTIKEVPVENYTTKIKGHTIENTYVNDKRIKFSGKKTWQDYDDKFDTRPDEVTIYLLRGNEKIEETTAKKETGWTYSFTNEGKGYPVYDDEGEVIDYRVLEKDVQGYETTITKPTESIEDVAEITGYDINNTYVNTEKTQLSGSKEWDDFDNKYDSRPEKIKVTLYKGSEKTDMTQEMSEKTGWTYAFKELPVYDKDGNPIEYSVKEEVVKDYEEVQGEPNFINKWIHKDDTTFIEGIKDWEDEQNKLGKRPNEVTIILYQNGQPMLDENDQIVTQEVSVTTFWKYRFDNLPKYDENGDEFVYSVKEEQVPGYVTEIVNNDVVNTYNNSKTTWVSGKKVWNDQGNKVNSRPESITVELYQNEGKKPYKTKVVKPDIRGNWNYLFTNLPKYDEHLNEYQYTVKEVNVPHYDSTVNGFVIENTYKNDEVTEISGDKEWLDQNNKLNTRPDSIDVELYQNENEKPFKTETFKADENGNWSYAFTNLPKYDENLDEYHYSVKEVPVKDYDSKVLDNHTIVNTYQNKSMVNVQGDKIWDDHQDILHSRPESIVVNLHRNNKLIPIKYQKVMSDENGQWHYEFNELPKYDKNLNEYDYKVKEMKVPHYNSQVEIDPITGQMNITNTYDNTDLTEVIGQKIWKNDVNDKLNTRPESIRLDLYQIDPSDASREEIFVASQIVTPDAEGDWHYSFEDLPKFNDELIAYEYVVKEQPVEHYETTVDGTTVTNTYQNLTLIDLSGVKFWDDENNKLETRPNELFIELYQTTKKAPEVIEGQSPYRITKVEANHEGNWFYEFKDLPKYDDNLDDYVYTIREQEVIDYDNSINGMNVHNKYRNEELTQLTGKKIWVDFDNKLNTRPKSIEVELYQNGQLMHGKKQIVEPDAKGDWSYEFKELPKYDDKLEKYQYTVKEKEVAHYTSEVIDHNIVNTYENTELTQLTGKKIWVDEKNKLDTRPESITVELYQNGNLMADKTQIVKPNKLGQWSYEFKELPKYDSELNLYDYTVKEQTVPHYTSEVTDQGITNTYNNTEVTQVIGKKTWVDHDNKLKTRPKEIKVDLYQNDKLMEEKTQTVKPTKEGDWSYEFTDLPKYDKELNEYSYSVKEQPVSDYTSSVDGFDITNTYQNKEVVKRHVKKKWVDEDNKIESRPEKIKVNLYQNQGKKPYKTKIIKPDAEGNWEHTFETLPKYDDNYDEYTYTVEEEAVAHYKGKVEISEGNVVITNTYNNTDVVTVNGEKQWNDLDDKLGKRPEKIIVDLYQNKAKEPFATQEVTPDKEGNWSYEFKDLPKYDKELNEYDYTVKEHQVADYDTYVEGTTIVNTYKNVETTKVKGKKKWDDFGNKLSSRPESIKVDLYQNGGDKPFRTQEVTPNKFGNWKYTFKNLPKHDKDLNEYTYTVKEQPVSHYESHVEGTTITNTYQNTDITQVEGVKTWDDENDKLGKRPDFILVELYQLAPNDNVIQADQKPFKIQKVEADETGAWSYAFEDLPKYDEKLNEFNYVIQEHQVIDYQGEVTDNNIHNTYQNTEKTNIKGEKIWVDEDDKYHTRPKSIQIELYQNGELLKDHTQKIKADKEGDWSYEFTDLPKYDDELTEYTYTVNEVPVKGYTTSVQGTTITNTLEKDPTDPDKPEPGKPGPNTPVNPSTTGKGQFLPKTGEEVTTHFMTSLIGLAVITLVGFLGYRRREQ
ncbi:Cna B-type domain-containing protein [Vagococcus sp. DIV0080]|uniref:Cna B-type domain-containing protein n=1 Tax=Candidatus Vagococcus giribetii TaxID=2230876 RepID=A0ABS3HV62_9ENTE|nr:Cna B-type domain-containing protein [Vagococcus sp. DIV0080]MBO0477646.1 Cna B-type domain-containing protein [Vagococcus sp. DIV0080]